MTAEDDYFVCPNCGEDVAIDSSFCRECGASGESGWEDEWSEDDSEDDFDYDEFISREFPDHASMSPVRSLQRGFVVLVVLLVCLALALQIIL
jgi:uncharacterized membrane protein YvbJ